MERKTKLFVLENIVSQKSASQEEKKGHEFKLLTLLAVLVMALFRHSKPSPCDDPINHMNICMQNRICNLVFTCFEVQVIIGEINIAIGIFKACFVNLLSG